MTVQYLIDSENVGDFWIPLLELPADKSELIVFYTRNSPHMSYESLIRLKESDRTVTFIKCYEGTNALDFQLVSELGYLIGREEGDSFVIVTNDTGYDAAVKYWRRKKKSVKRITGKECKNLERRLKEDLGEGRSSRRRPLSGGYSSAEPEVSGKSEVGDLFDSDNETAGENEQRSSRPVLRDAESAALPDSEEDPSVETAVDLQEEGSAFDDPSYDPSYDPSFNPSFEDPYEDYDEDPDQEMADEAVFPDDTDDDGPDPADEYAQPEEEETEADFEEESGEEDGTDTEPETMSEESDGSRVILPGYSTVQEETAEEGSKGASDELFPQDSDELLLQDHSGQESNDPGLIIPGKETEFPKALENGGLPEKADGTPSEENLDSPSAEISGPDEQEIPLREETAEETSSETDKGEKDDQVLSSESGHHSKSRRSRTRRSRSGSRKQEQTAEEEQEAEDEKQHSRPAEHEEYTGSQSQSAEVKTDSVPDDDEIAKIVACIGADNLAELHNQLATFYGDQGKDIYLSIKSNSRNLPVLKPDLGQKFAYYCEIIFARSDYTGEYPADISEFLLNAREKLGNLNSLRYALQKQYGKEKGRRFYFLLKPFAKTMYQM
jgi:hypothetical protein